MLRFVCKCYWGYCVNKQHIPPKAHVQPPTPIQFFPIPTCQIWSFHQTQWVYRVPKIGSPGIPLPWDGKVADCRKTCPHANLIAVGHTTEIILRKSACKLDPSCTVYRLSRSLKVIESDIGIYDFLLVTLTVASMGGPLVPLL